MKPAEKLLERTRMVVKDKPLKEVVEKRSPRSKVFQLDDKTFHVAQRLRPIHFKGDDGDWEEIELDFLSTFRVVRAPYKVSALASGKVGFRYTSRANDGWMEMELLTLDGKPVTATRTRDGDKVRWSVAPGVSMYLQALPDHPEIFKVYDAPHTTTWKVTDSGDFPGQFNPNTRGKDAKGDNLEIITDFTAGVFTEVWTGRVSRIAEKKLRQKAWFSDPAVPVLVDAAITENIADSADDVDETYFISTGTTSRGLEPATAVSINIGNNFNYAPASTSKHWGGFRFRTVALPTGATISEAILTVNVTNRIGAPTAKFYGNDVDNAGVWADPTNFPSEISKTTASATFTPASTGVKTIDVTTIIAEIGGRGAWASNNNLALAGFGQGVAGVTLMAIEDLWAAGTDEAQLDITYTVGGSPKKTLLLVGAS